MGLRSSEKDKDQMLQKWILACVSFYQRYISPRKPPSCRFSPTCSEYTKQAVIRHGGCRGLWLGCSRIGRCHPFHPGGHDPVP